MSKRNLVVLTTLIAIAAFVGGIFLYDRQGKEAVPAAVANASTLVRPHSPVIGPPEAPVTIVEFFDPMCEACRAFYPIVKRILADHPKDVRLVLRYTPFHEGADTAVRILETARAQGRFEPVLEVLMEQQPIWAAHGAPDLDKAWGFAKIAGLQVQRAQAEASSPEITRVLEQDIADVNANNVQQTPTFFVNGKPLTNFGPQQLRDLVQREVEQARKGS
ncbi:DsbA family protein [Microvirga mediterraneensis]|jgi:protein-disulfide isomerase|uniref:Thioredoxin domain-containing protein n=1 Tax=Microvirga mediterraneensis TaxID=2754695 RepID=A0A838BVE3_9HYPH|nr:thioredoxin domain-containing protein [Microvirga mediterraneensis]MBA1158855.1 thioredoxin domain-containing protein [Microvirga mediterraneensis]